MTKWYERATFFHMYPFGMVGAPKYNDGQEGHHFETLEKWLPHLEELGISAIYIGPLFESTSHGYDTKDYYQVDTRLGTNDEFKQFVQECHHRGIRVVVDGVFNHTGKEFFAFQDILQYRENSAYRYWYKDVDFSRGAPSGEPFYFAAWRNIYDLANLNLYNDEVRHYLFDVIRFWIQEFDIDGIRLDCADCLEFEFMKQMRSLCDSLKEDFWLMGELIHGDYSRWIHSDMLHSSTNYELHKALYSAHNDHNYFEIAHSIRRQFDENGGIYKGMHLYSFVDNHDVDRIASKLNNTNNLLPVHILLYTLPGIPSIYYGSQWGIEGRKEGGNDDPLRPKLDVEYMIAHNPHPELTHLLAKLGKLKKEYATLTNGIYHELLLTNKQYAFERWSENECIVTAVNNDEQEAVLNIRMRESYPYAISLLDGTCYSINDTLSITLPANSGDIFLLSHEETVVFEDLCEETPTLIKTETHKSMDDIMVSLAQHTAFENDMILLRPISLDDLEDYHEYSSDPETLRYDYPPHKDINESLRMLVKWNVSQPLGKYGIVFKENNKLVGNVSIQMQDNKIDCIIGITIHKSYWRKTIATQTLHLLIPFVFHELEASNIIANVDVHNIACKRLLEKFGFAMMHSKQMTKNGKPYIEETYVLKKNN